MDVNKTLAIRKLKFNILNLDFLRIEYFLHFNLQQFVLML